jgi:phage tail protein X
MKSQLPLLNCFRRVVAVLSIVLITSVGAAAYTLVMRDGRRVEIPDTFVVTNSTLTYKVAPEIQVTVQLASVDIAATHKLNNDQRGRLLTRTDVPPAKSSQSPRTITNRDLETYRKARVESEVAYEKRRKELGLPSIAEQQRQLNEVADRAREQAIKTLANETQSESYWRQRASELRAEMSATDARIQSVKRILDETPGGYSFGALTTVVPTTFGLPFGLSPFPAQRIARPGVFQPRTGGTSLNLRVGVPLGNQGRLVLNARRFDGPRHFNRFGQGVVLAVPFQQADYGSERWNLVNQLNELTVYRATLQSRWRDLEEEARRAGAFPGWLR